MEFVWRLPLSFRIRSAESKWILRQVLCKYLPMRLVDRPKAGFGIPLATWLRGPLRDWAEALLDERRLREEGFFDPGPVRRTWLAFLKTHDEHDGVAGTFTPAGRGAECPPSGDRVAGSWQPD